MDLAYLNGDFLPLSEARVPVLDRGFILGDGIYEVIPVYAGRLFRLSQHLHRLENSLRGIRLSNPHGEGRWRELLMELVRANGGGDLAVYLQVTRGVALRQHNFPDSVQPTVFAMCSPLQPFAGDSGVAAVTHQDIRWAYCQIKATTLLANVLMRQLAHDSGAYETILLRDGVVTEGAASNVFVVRGDEILTPPVSEAILAGITRELLLELMREAGVDCREKAISVEDLAAADEIWLTSSSKEIVPVTRLDGKPVGEGRPGAQWTRAGQLLEAYKAKLG